MKHSLKKSHHDSETNRYRNSLPYKDLVMYQVLLNYMMMSQVMHLEMVKMDEQH